MMLNANRYRAYRLVRYARYLPLVSGCSAPLDSGLSYEHESVSAGDDDVGGVGLHVQPFAVGVVVFPVDAGAYLGLCIASGFVNRVDRVSLVALLTEGWAGVSVRRYFAPGGCAARAFPTSVA